MRGYNGEQATRSPPMKSATRRPHGVRFRRWTLRGAVVCCGALACLSASVLLAKPGVVKTKDGRTIEGDVDERADSVVVTVRGIPTTINKESVDSVQYTGSIEQQYQDRLSKLSKPETAADHLALARWLLDNRAYDLATKEVTAAQRIDPNNTDAATLDTTIQSQRRLDHVTRPNPGTGGTPTTPRPPMAGEGTRPPATVGAGNGGGSGFTASMHRYISADDINAIRQAEWPADENSIRVTFNNDVRRKYVQSTQGNAAQFFALSPVEQAKRILQDGTPEQCKDV